eukprot:TRINITY_DN5317_c0_g1_i1.p1 TRINITY_DN5317_c0_g1~~TRINITY_DN5317_c0_g1_i1.p1  ORF type:complete len:229 (-),score=57.01 TRINITY_DN5317_c0_g1_i1:66-752(-)
MKNHVFLALLLCFVAIAYGQSTPPALAKVFTTNFTIVASNLAENPTTFAGFLALDDHTGAGRLEFGGVEYIPLYIQSTFVANPNGNEVDGYWFQYPVCWTAGASTAFLELFPLAIPPSATFEGDKIFQNVECSVWSWYATKYDVHVQFWVNIAETNPAGQPIAKIVFGPFPDAGTVTWLFQDFTVGNFSSSLTQPPTSYPCTPPPFDLGEDFSVVKKMMNILLGTKMF